MPNPDMKEERNMRPRKEIEKDLYNPIYQLMRTEVDDEMDSALENELRSHTIISIELMLDSRDLLIEIRNLLKAQSNA